MHEQNVAICVIRTNSRSRTAQINLNSICPFLFRAHYFTTPFLIRIFLLARSVFPASSWTIYSTFFLFVLDSTNVTFLILYFPLAIVLQTFSNSFFETFIYWFLNEQNANKFYCKIGFLIGQKLFLLQQDCPNGRLTPAKFVDMYKMFFPSGNAEEFCDHVFRTFDMDKNGYIDFKVRLPQIVFFFFVQLFFTVQKENYLHDVTEIETLYWRSLLAFDGFYSECNFPPKYDWPLNIQEKWSSQKSFRSGITDITIRRPPLSHQPLFQWRSFEIIRANVREGWTNKKNTI